MNTGEATVIQNGVLVDATKHTVTPADILVVNDTIVEVGHPGISVPSDARVIDATGQALLPGLINAHTHSHGALAKAVGDRWNLELLLNANPAYIADRRYEDMYLSAQLGAVEMLLRGCTACYDLVNEFPYPSFEGQIAVGQAYADVGIRAVVAPMLANITLYDAVPGLKEALPSRLRDEVEHIKAAPKKALLEVAKRLLQAWPFDREKLNVALAPTIPLLCTDDLLIQCRNLATDYDAMLHTHMAESRVWAFSGQRIYRSTLTEHFDRLGILGPKFTAAHAIWITQTDVKRMGDRGASVAHNPSSNLRLGSGLADVRSMLNAGVNVGIGSDASNCGDHLNMFENMRLASYISRVQDYEPIDWLTTEEVLAMATEGSARALGLDGKLGRIAEGCKADLVFLDLDNINLVPLNDITNQLVHCENGAAVKRVMVNGRMLVENYRVTTVDYKKLVASAERVKERLDAAQEDRRRRAIALSGPVGTFCSGLTYQNQHS